MHSPDADYCTVHQAQYTGPTLCFISGGPLRRRVSRSPSLPAFNRLAFWVTIPVHFPTAIRT